ncbi:MAG: Asp23/Gls24 family envelope stress response protein [Christensenellales bacterium]
MEYKISNDLGLITISEDVLLKVAGYAALECYGIVAMSSKRAKDGFVEWLGKENLTKGVQVNITEAGIDIDLFIIVEYGISIVEVCNIIKSQVCYKIENMTGAKVRRVKYFGRGYPRLIPLRKLEARFFVTAIDRRIAPQGNDYCGSQSA